MVRSASAMQAAAAITLPLLQRARSSRWKVSYRVEAVGGKAGDSRSRLKPERQLFYGRRGRRSCAKDGCRLFTVLGSARSLQAG